MFSGRKTLILSLIVSPLLLCLACNTMGNSGNPGTHPATTQSATTQHTSAAKWQVLFDGTSAKGWKNCDGTTPLRAYEVEDGTLHRYQGGGDIYYDEKFGDFELNLEWKVAKGSNSGIFFRVNNLKEVWQTGLEVQVLDNKNHHDGKSPLTSAGALYGMIPADPDMTKPIGEWNKVRIVAKDNIVKSYLNGTLVASIDLDNDKYAVPQGKFPYPWKTMKREGYIVLQDHGDPVWYRNIRIKQL